MIAVNETAVKPASRIYFLDWLRVLSTVAVFFFHNARLFDEFSDWHVKNATTDFGASLAVAYLSQWIMPFFFILAGASVYFAFRRRNAGQYTLNRTLRLLIPFIFGILVIVAPQAYYELAQGGSIPGTSFFAYYPHYLGSLGELKWFHLWFLIYLFFFSLGTIPICLPFGKEGRSLITRIGGAINNVQIWIATLVILLTLIDIFVYPEGFWGNRDTGGWNILSYMVFFIFGYLIFSNQRLLATITRFRWYFFSFALVLLVSLFTLLVDPIADPGSYFGSMQYNLAHFLRAVHSCAWMLAFIGLASRYLNFNNRFLNYTGEAVLPFYILHQTVIVSIGYYVVAWNMGVAAKYFLTAVISFVIIMTLYEVVIRRFPPVRFLFGMSLSRSRKR